MSHTPKPWVIRERVDNPDNGRWKWNVSNFEIQNTVADCPCRDDANIIAAAPEMLEALERARSHFVEFRNMRWVPLAFEEHLVDWIDEIDKVLAKARGQS